MRYILVIAFTFIYSLGFTQEVERAIKISKEVGRTIDSVECRMYNLDFCTEDFISAQIISISSSTMILRITQRDTVTDSYFSNKDLTDLKIKVGDEKYSKDYLESMQNTYAQERAERPIKPEKPIKPKKPKKVLADGPRLFKGNGPRLGISPVFIIVPLVAIALVIITMRSEPWGQ